MEIEPIQGEGLRVSMDFYLRLRRDEDGADFLSPRYHDYLTEKLAPFLPRMEYNPIDNTVTASLFQDASEQSREEMLWKSEGIDNLSSMPEKAYKALKKKIGELLREVDAEGADPEMKSVVEAFALPDPQKSPELYRVYGKGKLAILWGLECNPGESIPLRKFCQDGFHSLKQRKKWVPRVATLAGLVLLVVGIVFWYQGACGGNGGTTPVEQGSGGNGRYPSRIDGGDSHGTEASTTPKEGESEPSASTVSSTVDQQATRETQAKPSNGDKENTGEDGEGTQPPTTVSTSAPQTAEGIGETQNSSGGEVKTPAIDTVPDTPTVPTQKESTSPQPEGGGSAATETEGNSAASTDGTAEQEVQVDPMQEDIQVEFPGRVIDFRFDVLPRKDVAPGNVRVSVQVSVIKGADNAIESGEIKGVPLDANHRAEVQIKGREEELPYKIKLRNSKYPVTGGCKIKIKTTM